MSLFSARRQCRSTVQLILVRICQWLVNFEQLVIQNRLEHFAISSSTSSSSYLSLLLKISPFLQSLSSHSLFYYSFYDATKSDQIL